MPGARAFTGSAEPDARQVPWATLERLALEAGLFPPRYQPLSGRELAELLDRVTAGLPADAGADRELAHFWRDRYEQGGGWRAWRGCTCRERPPELRIRGRALAGWQEYGDPVAGEAGLAWGPGASAALELGLEFEAGAWWAAVTGRARGRVLAAGTAVAGDDALAWPRWRVGTGRADVRRARLQDAAWRVDAPRAAGGVRLGNWALDAGWAPRRVGPGRSGGLTLDRGGASFPAVTARRARPFRWRGFMKWLAPDDLLLRVGRLSAQDVNFANEAGVDVLRRHPWFFEWLVGWQPVPFLRVAATHTALAATDEGTLWPDVLQINFPVIGTTWRERESGPVTDRIFAVQFEGRWRDAPWPLLPARAGRVWWEYGGTDFLPSGPGGVVPEISAPASVAGVALHDPRWDLGCEYSELIHDKILWYTNSGYPDGYSHERWLLGNPLGGSAEQVAGWVRLRPGAARWEIAAELARTTWGTANLTPGDGERVQVTLVVRRLPGGTGRRQALPELHLAWFREEARPDDRAAGRADGLRATVVVGMP